MCTMSSICFGCTAARGAVCVLSSVLLSLQLIALKTDILIRVVIAPRDGCTIIAIFVFMVLAFGMSQLLSKRDWCPRLLWGKQAAVIRTVRQTSVFGARLGWCWYRDTKC
jgi:hypothetical protein